ncbi:notch-regulated ankyrin repeat-containing protein A-like [Stylophora pistillata]|uniref:notch-regulated ankyrin repeat-containing protein A-like n=1 Tax=Stylophora pistillata TaxID=50429 RepID=UPI000C0567E5|nr:notch-regulated ankyrin repeat-containing protein A-like [Stylophora pistillata]
MQDLMIKATSPEGSPAQKKRKRNSRRVPIDMMLQVQIAAIRQPKEREALKKRLRKQITCCEINEITTSGLTALNQCVLDGNLESAKMLVELGADVNKKDRFGWTALHYAASEGYENICRFLLRNGANVRAEDKEGKFPVEVTDDELILRLLLRATLLYNMPPLDKDSLQHSC